jgi:hypothetical protein
VEAILASREECAAILRREPRPFRLGEGQAVGYRVQRVRIFAAVDIDPEELAVPKLRDVDVGQVDQPIVPVGVEQPDGDSTQLTSARRTAATTAMTAVRY